MGFNSAFRVLICLAIVVVAAKPLNRTARYWCVRRYSCRVRSWIFNV